MDRPGGGLVEEMVPRWTRVAKVQMVVGTGHGVLLTCGAAMRPLPS